MPEGIRPGENELHPSDEVAKEAEANPEFPGLENLTLSQRTAINNFERKEFVVPDTGWSSYIDGLELSDNKFEKVEEYHKIAGSSSRQTEDELKTIIEAMIIASARKSDNFVKSYWALGFAMEDLQLDEDTTDEIKDATLKKISSFWMDRTSQWRQEDPRNWAYNFETLVGLVLSRFGHIPSEWGQWLQSEEGRKRGNRLAFVRDQDVLPNIGRFWRQRVARVDGSFYDVGQKLHDKGVDIPSFCRDLSESLKNIAEYGYLNDEELDIMLATDDDSEFTDAYKKFTAVPGLYPAIESDPPASFITGCGWSDERCMKAICESARKSK